MCVLCWIAGVVFFLPSNQIYNIPNGYNLLTSELYLTWKYWLLEGNYYKKMKISGQKSPTMLAVLGKGIPPSLLQ